MKIAIVISEFNYDISQNLLNGAFLRFKNNFLKNEKMKFEYEKDYYGSEDTSLTIFRVPGAFEIPAAVSQILKNNTIYDAVVTLGCVIKGETAHFEFISASVTDSISQISVHEKTNIPIILGVLTTYDYEQALKRSNPKDKDKGGEVMQAAIDTIKTFNKIKK